MENNSKEKAIAIMNKMNNGVITEDMWLSCSDYAKSDLKRKCLIVVDEVLAEIPMYTGELNPKWVYWAEVKSFINDF